MARGIVKTVRRWIPPSFRDLRIPAITGPVSDPGTPPHTDNLAHRYAPCRILDRRGIPNVIWFEDALSLYGSDTDVSDLYLLVPDEPTASGALIRSGYREAPLPNSSPTDELARRGGTRLESPDGPFRNATVLIRATEWDFDLGCRTECDCGALPPLDRFIDSLMSCWLDIPHTDEPGNYMWSLVIARLIGYAYSLPNPHRDLLESPAFAEQLQPEVRELHYDLIGKYPGKSDITSFRKHEYHSIRRQQIREGRFAPRPYPTECFPISLAEYPELTGMNIDIGDTSKTRAKKKKRRPVSLCHF